MNQEMARRCRKCRCAYEWVLEYGGNVQRCPQCGSLWLNGFGLQSLIRQMQNHRLDPEQMCCELGGHQAQAKRSA